MFVVGATVESSFGRAEPNKSPIEREVPVASVGSLFVGGIEFEESELPPVGIKPLGEVGMGGGMNVGCNGIFGFGGKGSPSEFVLCGLSSVFVSPTGVCSDGVAGFVRGVEIFCLV